MNELELMEADSSQSPRLGPSLPSVLEEARQQLAAVQARHLDPPGGQVCLVPLCLPRPASSGQQYVPQKAASRCVQQQWRLYATMHGECLHAPP